MSKGCYDWHREVAVCRNDAEPQNRLGVKLTSRIWFPWNNLSPDVALPVLQGRPGSVLLLASVKWIHFRYLFIFAGSANRVSAFLSENLQSSLRGNNKRSQICAFSPTYFMVQRLRQMIYECICEISTWIPGQPALKQRLLSALSFVFGVLFISIVCTHMLEQSGVLHNLTQLLKGVLIIGLTGNQEKKKKEKKRNKQLEHWLCRSVCCMHHCMWNSQQVVPQCLALLSPQFQEISV